MYCKPWILINMICVSEYEMRAENSEKYSNICQNKIKFVLTFTK